MARRAARRLPSRLPPRHRASASSPRCGCTRPTLRAAARGRVRRAARVRHHGGARAAAARPLRRESGGRGRGAGRRPARAARRARRRRARHPSRGRRRARGGSRSGRRDLSRSLERIIGDQVRRERARGARRHAARLGGHAARQSAGRSTGRPAWSRRRSASRSTRRPTAAGVRAVATSLLYASPPADRLTRGLAQRLAGQRGHRGFVFTAPTDSAGPGRACATATADGRCSSRAPSCRRRTRCASGCASARACASAWRCSSRSWRFLVAASRREAGALATLGAVLVVLRCIAVVPLSEFSTRSRLFDASVYFLRAGRAFTSNAAALTLTSATLLLAALLVVRRVRRGPPRLVGAAIAILGVVLGPVLRAHAVARRSRRRPRAPAWRSG